MLQYRCWQSRRPVSKEHRNPFGGQPEIPLFYCAAIIRFLEALIDGLCLCQPYNLSLMKLLIPQQIDMSSRILRREVRCTAPFHLGFSGLVGTGALN